MNYLVPKHFYTQHRKGRKNVQGKQKRAKNFKY